MPAKTRDLAAFIRWYIEANGHDCIADWMPCDTQVFMAHLEGAGRAATSVNRALAHLCHFAKWCQGQPGGVFALEGLPTRGIKDLATEESPCKKLDEREMHLLLKAADSMVLQGRDEDGSVRRKNARPRRNRALLVLLRRSQYDGAFLLRVQRKSAKGRGALQSCTCPPRAARR